jgi:formylglycine-generating enzyme required for sulfatase activity
MQDESRLIDSRGKNNCFSSRQDKGGQMTSCFVFVCLGALAASLGCQHVESPDHRVPPAASRQPAAQGRIATFISQLAASTGIKLVTIPAGTFTMGSADDEADRGADESPQTRVTLTKDFFLGATDVTQGQYESLMGTNPSDFKSAGLDAPVEEVSWDDAMTFCQQLTERERTSGRLPEGYAFTLPTEAQWEYACRAGTTGAYAGDPDAMSWYDRNSGGTTHPVGAKQPNAWGLYDMTGNVYQWCADWYANRYSGGVVTDPTGPEVGSVRILRGGGWYYDRTYCRSAYRDYDPGYRANFIGFRVALNPVQQ